MNHALLNRKIDPARFLSEPELMIALSQDDIFTLPAEQVAEIQLAGLKKRFHEMMEKIPVLRKLADEQGIAEIHSVEDAAPLLFKHSVYKSYPMSFIEKNRFDRLTDWLDKLTTVDLSGVDASGIDSIDDWIDLLDRTTPLRIIHTTGTSGKLSFLPRVRDESFPMIRGNLQQFVGFGDEPNAAEIVDFDQVPYVFPAYRHSAMAYSRAFDALVEQLYGGDESMVITLNPGRLSADALSLGGRLLAAQAKGEAGQLAISPKLMARREQLLKEQAEAGERARGFFTSLKEKYAGRRMAMIGNWAHLYDLAVEGRKQGLQGIFSSDSLVGTAGGTKGRQLPPDFKETVKQFLGVTHIAEGYGMSELTSLNPKCPHGYYHLQPWKIHYLLDPSTGMPLPRSGTQCGRLGVIDLAGRSYWAGFLTGDEVTITWDAPCACGRIGAYIHEGIRRFSDKEGGDDKITCAGAPDAHDKALEVLAALG